MNNWISVKDELPDGSEDYLLFIKQYRSDSGFLWAHHVICGFWSEEYEDNEKGFYSTGFTIECLGEKQNALDGTSLNEFLSDSKYIEVTHWMPLPTPPENQCQD